MIKRKQEERRGLVVDSNQSVFRIPPRRSGCGSSAALSAAGRTHPPCARRAPCCRGCARWRCCWSSPSLPPLKETTGRRSKGRRGQDWTDGQTDGRCRHSPRMKLYWASWAFLIFLLRVQPGSTSTSVMKPLLWNSCFTWDAQQVKSGWKSFGPDLSRLLWCYYTVFKQLELLKFCHCRRRVVSLQLPSSFARLGSIRSVCLCRWRCKSPSYIDTTEVISYRL